MPVRMNEKDRVRGKRRLAVFVQNILAHGQLTCVYCLNNADADPHVDHLVARNSGGHTKDGGNLVVSCPACNGRKGDTDVELIFGAAIAERVHTHVITRPQLTATDRQVCTDIQSRYTTTEDRLMAAYDWALEGLAPVR